MKHITGLSKLFIVAALFAASCDDNDNDNNTNTVLNDADKNFMTQAAYANYNEIDFAQMALTKATADTVKKFAQMMIDEHTMAMHGLDSVANQFTYTLPTTIDSLHAAMKTDLMAKSGHSFDTAYINSQVNDHQVAINLFQNESTQGNNVSVKNYATQTLPHLQTHLAVADSIQNFLE